MTKFLVVEHEYSNDLREAGMGDVNFGIVTAINPEGMLDVVKLGPEAEITIFDTAEEAIEAIDKTKARYPYRRFSIFQCAGDPASL